MIYLASNSPRRQELLRQVRVPFEVLRFRGPLREDTDICEDALFGEDPEAYVQRIAQLKAEGGVKRLGWRGLPAYPVLSADTTLAVDGNIIGKPNDAEHACEILRRLSGRQHRVLTAVAVSDGQRSSMAVNISDVWFTALSDDDIRRYVKTGEPMDKAGAYGIQGIAAMFISRIEGSYSGIMGLPLYETSQLLREFGCI
jgi:septum formation protein